MSKRILQNLEIENKKEKNIKVLDICPTNRKSKGPSVMPGEHFKNSVFIKIT